MLAVSIIYRTIKCKASYLHMRFANMLLLCFMEGAFHGEERCCTGVLYLELTFSICVVLDGEEGFLQGEF